MPGSSSGRWAPVAGTARRMRELKAEEQTLLSVDFAEPAGYLLEAADVGRVLVSPEGDELLCDPDPGRPDWAFILAAQALPLAATLRGLRGAARRRRGPRRAGPSSSPAIRGGQVLTGRGAGAPWWRACSATTRSPSSESEGTLSRIPGARSSTCAPPARDRLRPEERESLGAASCLRRSPALRDADERAGTARRAVSARAREAGAAIEPLAQVDPFELLAATFNLSVRTPARLTRQLDLVAALAGGSRVHRLRIRPGDDATGSAAAVRSYLAGAHR